MKKGNVDSITVFAKCHHSLCYYPTKIGTVHPHLNFDLTGAMIEAAHEIGVRAPIYITADWSDKDAMIRLLFLPGLKCKIPPLIHLKSFFQREERQL